MSREIDFDIFFIRDEAEDYLLQLESLVTDPKRVLFGLSEFQLYLVEPRAKIRLTRPPMRPEGTPWFEFWGIDSARDVWFQPAEESAGIEASARFVAQPFQLVKHFHWCAKCESMTAQVFLCLPLELVSTFQTALTTPRVSPLKEILSRVFLQQFTATLLQNFALEHKQVLTGRAHEVPAYV